MSLLATLLFCLLPLQAPAADTVVLESFGPLSSSPREDGNKNVALLGGLLQKSDDDAYRRMINTGANPGMIEGPERIYFTHLEESNQLQPSQLRPAFSLKGYNVSDPSAFRPPGSNRSFMYYLRGDNKIAEACRKKGESLRSCPEYATSREIGLAVSDDSGLTWTQKEIVVSAKEKGKGSGDESGPAMPSAVFLGDETWLYYSTGRQIFTKENIYRLRLSADGTKRLAEPEPVKLSGFDTGLSLENIQVVRLRCEEGTKFVETLIANNRARSAFYFYISDDGLRFKLASNALIPNNGHVITSPTQMPGPASIEECHATTLSGVKTARELLYSEEIAPDRWLLKRTRVQLVLP